MVLVFRGKVAKLAVAVVAALLVGTLGSLFTSVPDHAAPAAQEPSGLRLAVSVHYTIPTGKGPDGAAYDTKNLDVYVSNGKSNNVTVVSSTTHTHSSIPVGKSPADIVFDADNGNLYVPNTNSSNVSVISNSNKVIANPSLGKDAKPESAYPDPANGDMFVANASSFPKDDVAWLIGNTTNKATKVTLGLGVDETLTYNPSSKELYVVNTDSETLSAIAKNGTVKSIALKGEPEFVAPDPATGDLLVTLLPTTASGNVSVEVLSSADKVLATIKLPNVSSLESELIAYDPFNHDVYLVGFSDSKDVSAAVIISESNTLAATLFLKKGVFAALPFYDPANGDVYFTSATKNITVINETKVVTTLTVAQPVPLLVYDPTLKDMVGAGDVNLTTTSTLYFVSSTDALTHISVGKEGIAFLYNPTDTYVWVLDLGSANLKLVG